MPAAFDMIDGTGIAYPPVYFLSVIGQDLYQCRCPAAIANNAYIKLLFQVYSLQVHTFVAEV
jgi:hypothetical protein